MEKNLITGIGLFALAQTTLTSAFLLKSVQQTITLDSLFLLAIISAVVIIYMFFFIRYLDSSSLGLGKFKKPVIVYCTLITLMLLSSILLFLTSNSIEAIVYPIAAIIFVTSDSFIAIREFHHKINNAALKVLTTYYLAILLFGLSILIY